MHWTYDLAPDDAELEQGDILTPTDELRGILARVHAHFCADKYLGFLVTTQSCDLVIRSADRPKASYINIAAIRSLAEVAPRIIASKAAAVVPKVFRSSSKLEAKRLLGRLLNQNEQSLGLFYLHADADSGVGEPAAAFLRVTIALRADHYGALVRARRGRLDPEFRGKLGSHD